MEGLGRAAGGLDFSRREIVARHRADILRASVFSRAMPPPGGAPGLEDDEKSVLMRWAERAE
jgi:hypothetical protein